MAEGQGAAPRYITPSLRRQRPQKDFPLSPRIQQAAYALQPSGARKVSATKAKPSSPVGRLHAARTAQTQREATFLASMQSQATKRPLTRKMVSDALTHIRSEPDAAQKTHALYTSARLAQQAKSHPEKALALKALGNYPIAGLTKVAPKSAPQTMGLALGSLPVVGGVLGKGSELLGEGLQIGVHAAGKAAGAAVSGALGPFAAHGGGGRYISKEVGRTAEDFLNMPIQTIPTGYQAGAAAVEALQGNPARAKALGEGLLKGSVIGQLAQGHVSQALKQAEQHPGFAASELAGGYGAAGRVLGGTARLLSRDRVAGIARPDLKLTGEHVITDREYSPNLVTNLAQRKRDQIAVKKAQGLRTEAKAFGKQASDFNQKAKTAREAGNPEVARSFDVAAKKAKTVYHGKMREAAKTDPFVAADGQLKREMLGRFGGSGRVARVQDINESVRRGNASEVEHKLTGTRSPREVLQAVRAEGFKGFKSPVGNTLARRILALGPKHQDLVPEIAQYALRRDPTGKVLTTVADIRENLNKRADLIESNLTKRGDKLSPGEDQIARDKVAWLREHANDPALDKTGPKLIHAADEYEKFQSTKEGQAVKVNARREEQLAAKFVPPALMHLPGFRRLTKAERKTPGVGVLETKKGETYRLAQEAEAKAHKDIADIEVRLARAKAGKGALVPRDIALAQHQLNKLREEAFGSADVKRMKFPYEERAQNEYTPDPASIAEKTFYHGTGTKGLSSERLDSSGTQPDNLYGQGVYLTTDPEIARGYGRARGSRTEPTLYEVKINPRKVLDLESPLSPTFHSLVNRTAHGLGHLGQYGEHDTFILDQLKKGLDEGHIKTNADLYDAFRGAVSEYASDYGLSKSDIAEYFQDFASNFRAAGWDAMTHIGGARTGHDPHQVVIVPDPMNMGLHDQPNPVVRFAERGFAQSKIAEAGVAERIQKAEQQIAEHHERVRVNQQQAAKLLGQITTHEGQLAELKAVAQTAKATRKAAYVPKALRTTKREFAIDDKPITLKQAGEMLAEAGYAPAYVVHTRETQKGAFFKPEISGKGQRVSAARPSRTGHLFEMGLEKGGHEGLRQSARDLQTSIDAAKNFDQMLSSIGAGHYTYGKDDVTRIQRRLTEDHGDAIGNMVPIRLAPFDATAREMQSIFESYAGRPKEDARIAKSLDDMLEQAQIGNARKGDVFTFISEGELKQWKDLAVGPKGDIMRQFTQNFRSTVLPFSTKWYTGNAVEGLLRSGLAGHGMYDLYLGARATARLKKAEARGEVPEGTYRRFVSATLGGLHAASVLDRQIRHEGNMILMDKPVAMQVGHWLKTVRSLGLKGNKAFEKAWDTAALGQQLQKSMRAIGNEQGRWNRYATELMDQAIQGKALDMNKVLAMKSYSDKALGRYSSHKPGERLLIAKYTPFLDWYRNALYFNLYLLPVKHPQAAGAISAFEETLQNNLQSQNQFNHWLHRSNFPEYLLGAVPAGEGTYRRLQYYTPWSAMADPLGTATDLLLPQLGFMKSLAGLDWTNQPLKGIHGEKDTTFLERLAAGAISTVESQIPLERQIKGIREGGARSGPYNSAFWPAKGGTGVGAGLKQTFNPFQPTRKPQSRGRGGARTEASALSRVYGGGMSPAEAQALSRAFGG